MGHFAEERGELRSPSLAFLCPNSGLLTTRTMWRTVQLLVFVLAGLLSESSSLQIKEDIHQPLSRIRLDRSRVLLDKSVSVFATPDLLGSQGETSGLVTVTFKRPFGAAVTDWIAVFSPANFDSSQCKPGAKITNKDFPPFLCTSPIKFQYCNYSSADYGQNGAGSLTFRLINQRSDFSFGFFEGDLSNPVLLAISNTVRFDNPKVPAYERLAQGFAWNEMTVTWTSGYSLDDGIPLVRWGPQDDKEQLTTAAVTLTYARSDMCGPPASTVGWRDPGYFHTGYLKDLWPSYNYYYKVGHKLFNGSYVWGQGYSFKSAPFPGQNSLQRVVIFGDMGKVERDGSNVYNDYQPGALNTTDTLVQDLDNFDILFLIGDLSYANGYLSEWDQFTEQVGAIARRVPFMIASGNHERDWPGSGSYYQNTDSGGECGVVAETMYSMPLKNRAKFWYSTDYGLFHFCVADTEHDWREGSEQYKFIEECLASVDRQKQPWLVFIAHRVVGYSSGFYYAYAGDFGEPGGRGSLQGLWQKYKVDLAFYGHIHSYERTCPVYENVCLSNERRHYSGTFNATIHLVVGGGGAGLADFTTLNTSWSLEKDHDFGFTKLTAYNQSSLLLEYKRSSDGQVYDEFWISREYKDVLGCDGIIPCQAITLAT